MAEFLNQQVKKVVKAKRNYKRYLALLLCLSMLVGLGTVAALTQKGEALTHKKKVLDCSFTPAAGEGYAGYVAHVHNDDCYDAKGTLLCTLPEIPAHYHTDACWETVKETVCGLEESAGHVHTEDCYARGEELVCGLAETEGHTHSDDCYAWYTDLTCGEVEYPEHWHGDDCYSWTTELICGLEEGEEHTHDENCYGPVRGELICGQTEGPGHTHDDSCYGPVRGELICGLAEVEPHTHTAACHPLTDELICGLEEGAGAHTHDESCWHEVKKAVCGFEGIHIHNESCYDAAGNLVCGQMQLEAHVHGEECFKWVDMTPEEIAALDEEEQYDVNDEAYTWVPAGDPNAGVETWNDWNNMFLNLELTGNWSEDLLAVARTQLGYGESAANYALSSTGGVKGYTRYGAWYGIPYGDWCAMFASFCIRWAGIPEENMPVDCNCSHWINQLAQLGMYASAENYNPKPGDLVFYDFNYDDIADHVGIVAAADLDNDTLITIEGNRTDYVQTFTLRYSEACVMGYGLLPVNPNPIIKIVSEDETETENETGLTQTQVPEALDESISPEQDFSDRLGSLTVTVHAPAGAFPENTEMRLSLVDPENLMATVNAAVDQGISSVQAVDISFYDEHGQKLEPRIPIDVSITSDSFTSYSRPILIHVKDNGVAEIVNASGSGVVEDELTFTEDEFSVYILVSTTIEKTVLASDGHNYKISVTFGPDAQIPEGAELLVSEIGPDTPGYEDYMASAESTLKRREQLSFARFFDITIVKDEMEVQPSAPVQVKIQLADELTADVKALHFGQEEDGSQRVDVIPASLKTADEGGKEVVFNAEGFSVYGIILTKTIETEFMTDDGQCYTVTVTYGEDANIPEGAKLRVVAIDQDSEAYDHARKAVLAEKKAKGEFVNLDNFGLAALDISILNADDEEIEPEAAVTVDIRIKELPGVESLEEVKDTLEIQHHVEVADGVVVEKVFDGSVEGSYEMDTDANIAKTGSAVDPSSVSEEDFQLPEIEELPEEPLEASFETEVFSTFTITWRYYPSRTVTVHYVDESGNELDISNPAATHPNMDADSSSPAFLIYDIDGYEYSYTYRNTNNNRIAPLLAKNNNNRWMYNVTRNNNGTFSGTELTNGDNIYVVYKKSPTPTTGGTAVIDLDDETWPEGSDAPQFSKSSTNNGDGTNTIALSIAASEKPVEKKTPADVIVIMDVSGSMQRDMAGSRDGQGNYNTYQNNDSRQRLYIAKQAVNEMADTLLNASNSDVRMALISFSTDAGIVQEFTDNYNTFSGKVNTLNPDGGTNWEKALAIANSMAVRENAATFVVFVTDGDPTFRISRGDVANNTLGNNDMWTGTTYQYYRENQVFGTGSSDPAERNFDFAAEQVGAIAGASKSFYAVGVSNDVGKVINLTTAGGVDASHAFSATDDEAMQEAFSAITEAIKSALGFGDVGITDGITELTNAEMKVMQSVDPNSFRYYRWGGEGNKYGADEAHKTEWTTREADGCAAASYDETDGAVHWDMGAGFQLEDNVTYVVTFKVWPSQDAYDLVADLNNGIKVYAEGQPNSITAEERAQVVELSAPTATEQGSYALKTNTDQINATYKKTTKTGEVVTIADNTPITAAYNQGTIQNMALESMLLKIKKEFEDDLTAGEDRETQVTLVLKRRFAHQTPAAEFEDYAVPQSGGTVSPEIVLNEGNNWTYSLYVAPGVEVNGEVLEHGYDFTLAEPGIDYHYDLIEEIINPMVVDGEDKYYGDGYLLLDDETVEEYTDQALTAVNRVKSGIDIHKQVFDVDGKTEIFPETEFTVTGKLLAPDGSPFTWQDGDDVNASGAYHKYDRNGNRIVYKGHFASTDNISFTLKAGEYIRFINVPDGCTFEFTEMTSGMDALGYEWVSTEAATQHRTSPGGPFSPDGDVQPVVEDETAKLTTGVVGNKQYSVSYTNKRTVPLPEVELVKTDAKDTGMKLNDAEFALYEDAERTKPVTVDGDGNAIAIKTGNKPDSTGPDGWYHIGKLPAGTYYMYETAAPSGYVQDDTPVIITVTKNATSYSVTATKDGTSVISGPVDGVYTVTLTNERATTYVKVFKYTGTDKPLEGAVFSLTGPEGTGITYTDLTSNAEGYLVFEKGEGDTEDITYVELPFTAENTYYVLKETHAPDGYNQLAEDINFAVWKGQGVSAGKYTVTSATETIKDAEVTVYTIQVPNSAGEPLPRTGGMGVMPFTVGGLALTLCALALLLEARRRQRRRGDANP